MDRREEILQFLNNIIRNMFNDKTGRFIPSTNVRRLNENEAHRYKCFLLKGIKKCLNEREDKDIYKFGDMIFTKADIWLIDEISENLKTLGELEK